MPYFFVWPPFCPSKNMLTGIYSIVWTHHTFCSWDGGPHLGPVVPKGDWLSQWKWRWLPNAPWCWYIYLQNWVIYGANVGKYSSTMEHMGLFGDIPTFQTDPFVYVKNVNNSHVLVVPPPVGMSSTLHRQPGLTPHLSSSCFGQWRHVWGHRQTVHR